MRKIAANLIFPISSPPIKNGYVVLSDEGEVIDISGGGETITEIAGLEYYSGILVPGFVNAHCQLEISHLKAHIASGLGLVEFIKKLTALRQLAFPEIEKEIQKAMRYMWSRGINAVGDIVNTNLTIAIKGLSPVKTLNFIELHDREGFETNVIFNEGCQLQQELDHHWLNGHLTAHSFHNINDEVLSSLIKQTHSKSVFSINYKEFPIEKINDLEQRLKLLLDSAELTRLILVQNIYLQTCNIKQLIELFSAKMNKLYWVLCPNSNLYIEKILPPVMEMHHHQLQICIGTDSLASNHQLSILDEMITLQQHFPEVAFNDLIKWATLNGAKSLGMENELGSFEKGKNPGVLLITGFDFQNFRLKTTAEVTRLV